MRVKDKMDSLVQGRDRRMGSILLQDKTVAMPQQAQRFFPSPSPCFRPLVEVVSESRFALARKVSHNFDTYNRLLQQRLWQGTLHTSTIVPKHFSLVSTPLSTSSPLSQPRDQFRDD